MDYLVNQEQMKQIDSYTVEKIKIPSIVLMERAALAVTKHIIETIPKNIEKILVVCGIGNNGGDGVAVARMLCHQGYFAHVLVIGDEMRASKSMKDQLIIARNLGISIFNTCDITEYNIIVDAIFGIGLSKEIDGVYADIIKQINESKAIVYAIDIPSGVNANDGSVSSIAVKADYTITFGKNKLGLVLYPGKKYAGDVTIADIGFPKEAIEKAQLNIYTYDKSDLTRMPERDEYSNKGTFGKILVIAGSKNMSGACYLCAKAAYMMGAGLVKVLTVEENRTILQTSLPEAIFYSYDPTNLKNKTQVDQLVQEIQWASVIVIGPGISCTYSSDSLLKLVLKYTTVPTIIDADGLNLLSTEGIEGLRMLPDHVILTPHLQEMSRFLHCEVSAISNHLLETAEKVTKESDIVLVLKDVRTIVKHHLQTYVNTSGNNGMATGGSGDVLTGVIAGLLAQKMDCFSAASLGVYLHGLAADVMKEEKSIYSFLASDIIEALPRVTSEAYARKEAQAHERV